MTRILAAALASIAALALAAPAHASRASDALKRELGPGVKVAAHGETGQVRFVGAAARPIETGAASARDAARVFVARHGDAFGGGDLAITSSHDSSVRFQQRVDGIPVVGGELVVNVDRDGDVVSASGELLPGSVDRTPLVTAAAARQEAIAAVAKERQVSAVRLAATTPRLWIYDARLLGGPGPRRPTLVWRLDVKGDSGLAIDDLVLDRRRPRPHGGAHPADRGGARPPGLRRQRDGAPGPVHRCRGGPQRGRGRHRDRGGRLRLRVRGRHVRLLPGQLRPRQPRRRRHDPLQHGPPLPQPGPVPVRQRLLERLADGLRRRLGRRRRPGGPRADARRHRLQRPPLLLLPIGRHQRVDVGRLRRARRPRQRLGDRHGRHPLAGVRGRDRRALPRHAEPGVHTPGRAAQP